MSAPCYRCGKSAERSQAINSSGAVVSAGYLCEPCWDAAWDEFSALRLVFQSMIDAGVSRVEANRIMLARISPRTPGSRA